MRADRLLSILLLLQARGRMTAQELADEVEVSQRTIYRDVEALSMAGVPVYADRGPGGGFALLDRYRTTLTGLNRDEVRALFMLSIPEPLAQLGLDGELKAALLKLSAALPEARRPDEALVRQRFHLDSAWWFQPEEPVPHLPALQQAVWEDRRLHLAVRLPFDTRVEWLVDPYGLVAKAGVWYLVCARKNHLRVHRVSDVLTAHVADERFQRPADFDLGLLEGVVRRIRRQPSLVFCARPHLAGADALPAPGVRRLDSRGDRPGRPARRRGLADPVPAV